MTASPPPQARKLAFLGNPRMYPHRPAHVRIIETHFAWVFLAGRYVFKLKKPARYAGMNYRTLAAREHGCREELRLNRRLAPSLYLDVIPLTSRAGRLCLDGQGRTVDFLVKMRRLPHAGMLEVQVRLQKAMRALAATGDPAVAAAARRHAGLALARAEKTLVMEHERARLRELAGDLARQ